MKQLKLFIIFIFFIMLYNTTFSQCTEPPRNIQYSSNFYKAQAYFMEKYNSKSANLNVLVQGVPIGGSASNVNWSTENSFLNEESAVNFIKQELSNYKAQILAEASSVLCQISQIPNPTITQLRAIEAIEKIATIALGMDGTNLLPNSNSSFELLPSNPYIFFKEDASKKGTLLLNVINKTVASLELVIEQENLPEDFPWDIKYAGNNLSFKLAANENKILPFYVNIPKTKNNPYIAMVKIKAKHNNSVFAVSSVNIIPSEDIFLFSPSISNGEIQTNAIIGCTAPHLDSYNDSHSGWLNVPYGEAGPNMGYGNVTHCFALTQAKVNSSITNKKQAVWTLDILNKCGGKCGPNGTNTGGHGEVKPNYRTKIMLPYLPDNYKWTINLRGSGTLGEGNANVFLIGNGVDRSFSFDRSGNPGRMTVENLNAGEYILEMNLPKLVRGCYGATQGTWSETIFNTNLTIEIVRTKIN